MHWRWNSIPELADLPPEERKRLWNEARRDPFRLTDLLWLVVLLGASIAVGLALISVPTRLLSLGITLPIYLVAFLGLGALVDAILILRYRPIVRRLRGEITPCPASSRARVGPAARPAGIPIPRRRAYNHPPRTMNDRLAKLIEKARALPKAPGVYLMKDAKGVVIYIGKSASLRDRVSSYFQPSTKLEFKKLGMVDEIVDFDVLQTETEVEALLAENRLIKDTQPRYNARLLDDKTFPYLMLTTRDDYPGVYVTREPLPKTELYGPFTSVALLKDAVVHLQKAFKFRTCHLEILEEDPKKKFFRPCLLYNIGQCTAPCADKIGRAEYAEDFKNFQRFLDGNRRQLLEEMDREMMQASKDMAFERAAKLRDQIKALAALDKRAGEGEEQYWQPEAFVHNPREGVQALQDVLGMDEPPRVVEGIDIAHLMGGEMVGSLVCFIDGVPFKNGYRRFRIRHGQGNNDYLSIQEVVTRRYREPGQGHELFPDVILIDGGLGQLHAAFEAFKLMDVKPPMVISLAKKEELIYVQSKGEPLKLSRNHLGLKLLQYIRDEAHRFAQHYHHILRRKAQLEEDVKAGRRASSPKRKRLSRLPDKTAIESPIEPLPSTIPSLKPIRPLEPPPPEEPPEARFPGDNE